MDRRVWMVAGAVPGDEVLARVLVDRGRYVEAIAESVAVPSPARRSAPCPVQSACGGCPLMVVDERAQRAAKHAFVVDALERVGRLSGLAIDPVVAAPTALGYRNKVELSFGSDATGRHVLGYHRAGLPSAIVDVARCAIADSGLQPLLDVARRFFLEGPGRPDLTANGAARRLRIAFRTSSTHDERLVALMGSEGSFASAGAFARLATEADSGLAGVVRILSVPGRRGGARVESISGQAWIHDEILDVPFRVPAATFLQVHPSAAEALGRHIVEGARSPGRVLELYGGVGGIGLALARKGARVTIVEADREAVASGREAAERVGIPTVRLVASDVGRYLRNSNRAEAPDLVIADPPRTGLGREVVVALAGLGARRLTMVSCDPATMARDVGALVAHGYGVDRIVPFDLFPQTAHVETVVWLSLAAGSGPGV